MWEQALTDCVTVWPTSTDEFGGHAFGEPIHLNARWQNSQEKYVKLDGNEHVSRAVVYLDCDVSLGDFIAQGELSGDPISQGALEIQAFASTHDLRRLQTIRKAIL